MKGLEVFQVSEQSHAGRGVHATLHGNRYTWALDTS